MCSQTTPTSSSVTLGLPASVRPPALLVTLNYAYQSLISSILISKPTLICNQQICFMISQNTLGFLLCSHHFDTSDCRAASIEKRKTLRNALLQYLRQIGHVKSAELMKSSISSRIEWEPHSFSFCSSLPLGPDLYWRFKWVGTGLQDIFWCLDTKVTKTLICWWYFEETEVA